MSLLIDRKKFFELSGLGALTAHLFGHALVDTGEGPEPAVVVEQTESELLAQIRRIAAELTGPPRIRFTHRG